MPDPVRIFDRMTVRRHRNRAAKGFEGFNYLKSEVTERLLDRLDDIKKKFPQALDLGCHAGELGRQLQGRGGVSSLVQTDISYEMSRMPDQETGRRMVLVADEELLPFAENSFDLVLSSLALHWINDLPGTLAQIHRILKPDGLFLAAMLGGETLKELRHVLGEAEIDQEGGLTPRVSPFADGRDAGNLLQRAGFAMPVMDMETLTVSYGDPFKLLTDLRGMGEGNALYERRKSFSRRQTIADAAKRYVDYYADDDGRLPATFDILYLTAWAPHESQPKSLAPGSATHRLSAALEDKETPDPVPEHDN